MSLQVVGAGFGRTGTLSLKLALEQLGFSKCHHMREVMSNPDQIRAWHAIALGADANLVDAPDTPDWDTVFDGYAACVDWPSCTYWEELHDRYPDSKVILTIRDPDRWYESALETIYPSSSEIPRWILWMSPRARRAVELLFANVWDGTFDGRFEDRAHAIGVFNRHIERVKERVAHERLLVFQATDGWEPLCAFLGVPVPDEPYPHVNEAAEIKRVVRVLRALRWLPHLLVAAVVLWLVI
jgi:hypothetical protein